MGLLETNSQPTVVSTFANPQPVFQDGLKLPAHKKKLRFGDILLMLNRDKKEEQTIDIRIETTTKHQHTTSAIRRQ
ncbi:MAG: hypothetical protein A2W90_21530 [Bacteroidetes bacterium GWF2_42_66]|nr:MAG: hypothetical protein A2W92_04345 [Bacteroidetes bacterium GWA2_42_15]OFX98915.1 MAG: hypothetical protein A2W89_13165 [Bacteroidetes bacterium GWE2_42_39]OFY45630.1 MAG: hypothetical protein A2W90_21530 [Bacteroidetes bacterium GWF2_42_66]HBL77389.1 hypothetical protein [Prolixibacteraceae bacterium]HCU62447.1 hypothetical protein [Prolixibacteraceae bacterium]